MADVLLRRFSPLVSFLPITIQNTPLIPRLNLSLIIHNSESKQQQLLKRLPPRTFKVQAVVAEGDQPKWWEKNAGPNMVDIHSTQDFLNELSRAGDKLIIVEFYGTWCGSCRALFPKQEICRTKYGDQPKWWEKNAGPNMVDIHSTQDFLNELSRAGDKLIIVEFYGTWCGSCRALFPKLCKTAQENPDILFLKVNFDENKPMCKRLNVRVLPFFHFYRGADGLLESFSCSLAKYQKIRDAIATHNTARCSIGPALGVGDLLEEDSVVQEKPAEASSR